jgi:glycine/D-amino acid oxidase-like deaminating enzyme
MLTDDRFEILVIGSGPAGQRAAIQAAKLGRTVAIIERRPVLGGVSASTGTLPSKYTTSAPPPDQPTLTLDNLTALPTRSPRLRVSRTGFRGDSVIARTSLATLAAPDALRSESGGKRPQHARLAVPDADHAVGRLLTTGVSRRRLVTFHARL